MKYRNLQRCYLWVPAFLVWLAMGVNVPVNKNEYDLFHVEPTLFLKLQEEGFF